MGVTRWSSEHKFIDTEGKEIYCEKFCIYAHKHAASGHHMINPALFLQGLTSNVSADLTGEYALLDLNGVEVSNKLKEKIEHFRKHIHWELTLMAIIKKFLEKNFKDYTLKKGCVSKKCVFINTGNNDIHKVSAKHKCKLCHIKGDKPIDWAEIANYKKTITCYHLVVLSDINADSIKLHLLDKVVCKNGTITLKCNDKTTTIPEGMENPMDIPRSFSESRTYNLSAKNISPMANIPSTTNILSTRQGGGKHRSSNKVDYEKYRKYKDKYMRYRDDNGFKSTERK